MNQPKRTFLSREERNALLATTGLLENAFAQAGLPFPDQRQGENYRLDCLNASCDGKSSSYGQLSVESKPPYRIQCFSCEVKGDIFELLLLLKDRQFRKARGKDFQLASEALRDAAAGSIAPASQTPLTEQPNAPEGKRQENVPMYKSENEGARNVINLHEQGVTDIANMDPAASKYFRQRPFLTPEVCEKWGVFYVPSSEKSTLRGRIAYQIENVRGELLAIAGRDPKFETKFQAWRRTEVGKAPVKTRFPTEKYFKRGLELFGQQASRLEESGYLENIRETGIWLVEGFNDVIALDAMAQPALGLMSNKITDSQVEKLVRFCEETTAPGVTLFLDSNEQGIQGSVQVFEKLADRVPLFKLGNNGQNVEPEHLTRVQLEELQTHAQSAWSHS